MTTWRILADLTEPIDCLPDHRADSAATLCPACARQALDLDLDVAMLLAELAAAARRDVRMGGQGGRTSTSTPLPVNLAAAETADLISWTRAEFRAQPGQETLWEYTQQAIAGLRLIDRPNPAVYAGRCPTCGEDLAARTDQQTTTCGTCGTVIDLPAHRASIIEQGEQRWLTLPETLQAVSWRLTRPQLDWGALAGLIATERLLDPFSGTHSTVYLLGDVLTYTARQESIDRWAGTIDTLAYETGIKRDTIKKRAQRGTIQPVGKNHQGALLYARTDITRMTQRAEQTS